MRMLMVQYTEETTTAKRANERVEMGKKHKIIKNIEFLITENSSNIHSAA